MGDILRDRTQKRNESVKDDVYDKMYLINRYEPEMETTQLSIIGAGLYYIDCVGIRTYDTVEDLLEVLIDIEANKLNVKHRKEKMIEKGKSYCTSC